MDGTLREQGVGDLVVGKRVGKLMSALGGRIEAYREGLAAGDQAVLEGAVRRNVTLAEQGDASWIAAEIVRLAGALAATDDAALLAGRIAR
jgi:cytochrome b pre-mRNA-processing protein 3